MQDLFEATRGISCPEAAEKLGWPIKRRGGRAWARCPFHGERTASLCLYEGDRGFYCFGCHEGGDVVRLYEKALNISALEAATQLATDFGIANTDLPQRRAHGPTAYDLRRALETRYNERFCRLCDARWKADAMLGALGKAATPEARGRLWGDPRFLQALMARSRADQELDLLGAMSPGAVSPQALLEYFKEAECGVP